MKQDSFTPKFGCIASYRQAILDNVLSYLSSVRCLWSKPMLAENYSASLVSRLAVPGNLQIQHGYYRSKLFTVSSTTNPLVAAAGPLLSLLERLCVSHTLPPIIPIRENIDHELHAFTSKLTSLQYADELAILANYLLRATIDELLGKNYLRIHSQPAEFKAFTPSSYDDSGPERRFFAIVNHIKERTNQYLDLIELAYYCLIAGYEGEQHLRADGRQTLDNLIEELFQLIQQHRVNKPLRLFREPTSHVAEPINHHKSIIAASLLALAFLISTYFISHSLLEHKAKTMLHGQTVLAANMDN